MEGFADTLISKPALLGNLITATVLGLKWIFDDFIEPSLIRWRIKFHLRILGHIEGQEITASSETSANLSAAHDKEQWRKWIVPLFTGITFFAALLLILAEM